ncbi:ATP-grasp domain-containing protein [Mycetocola manganoxydans]|uniref:ATP-grasp domain-containing protein n=1 Tax=Mycetocola manganoxydans TaxID=699879 RepID=A0A3L6ZS75_9MICO|nr:ATP-grasp domain-containing protein [Mycetocola manganoxydans]RLP70698.1 ATP-grasp domain-containing protein [Mycetocola manganoxydans]GHD48806.1 carbamoyl phosphate synthase [Mycetocola manganoxydans]
MTRVLVTGTGGPAGVAVLRSLLKRADVDLFSADMDGWASGLYLVSADRRRIVPRGDAADFVDAIIDLCRTEAIDVVFSTVDAELPALAARRADLKAAGAVLAAPSIETLDVTLDKYLLAERVTGAARVPTTHLLTAEGASEPWDFPVIVKPRRGAGSRGVRIVDSREALVATGFDEALIIQEFLPGDEFSVDVFADASGRVLAAVPRTRTRVDSGVSIAGRTVRDSALEETAATVAAAIGLTGVANVQLRLDRAGIPALLEVNPRFPGAMPLTIAAGVDMPSLALDLALGTELPERIEFAEIANVRYLEDVFVPTSEILISENAAHDDGLDQ